MKKLLALAVFCGPGVDGVDQMPVVLPDDELREQQSLLQYAPGSNLPELGFVAEDRESIFQ